MVTEAKLYEVDFTLQSPNAETTRIGRCMVVASTVSEALLEAEAYTYHKITKNIGWTWLDGSASALGDYGEVLHYDYETLEDDWL